MNTGVEVAPELVSITSRDVLGVDVPIPTFPVNDDVPDTDRDVVVALVVVD